MKQADKLALQRAALLAIQAEANKNSVRSVCSNSSLTDELINANNRAAAQLADTIPPTEPPQELPVTFAKRHQLVRWHRFYSRVTKLPFDSLELARAAAAELSPVIFYRWEIMCGRESIEARNLKEESQDESCKSAQV